MAAVAAASAFCVLTPGLTGCGASGGSPGGPDSSSGPVSGTRPPAGQAAEGEDGPDSGDFNGDGHDDYATVVRSEARGGNRGGETLLVVYGSRKGLNHAWTTRARGTFSYAPLRTDLNGDGFTDLVGGRARGTGTETFAMFGGPRGLTGPRALDVPRGFGPKAAGDFDGDGKTDLFDAGGGAGGGGGGRSARIVHGPFDPAGKPSHEHAREPVSLDLSQHGYTHPEGVAAGDFDADGRTDLVLTYGYDAEEDETAPDDLTPVAYYRGTRRGLSRERGVEPALREALAGGEDGPRTPSTGDVDGDGTYDLLMPLAVPTSYEEEKAGKGGGVGVLFGARSGLGTGKRTLRITGGRDSSFGDSPAVGEVNGDHRPDIVVNTPDFRRHDGLVTLLPGGPGGPSAKGAQEIDVTAEGLPGTPNSHRWNRFTARPPLLDTNGDGHDDVLVFVPLYDARKGAFLEIPGTGNGFAPARARRLTPSDIGLPSGWR
ncbi:FG-GAP and VCBS repeat-containing protein [Streptomyces sp. 891-h]|uniref:FG-GAP repeat domain-containing protein n=1 Tax=unclassified Streptomyces TaxID=2593676 RepID=UPI001FA9D917|nr:FG-GAP and VCBS repeat-containing protein [Streptomyces sp. 891-h]UNZ17524.1 VCBS repeat-containing protein [Streptomyces sp. 891-h]